MDSQFCVPNSNPAIDSTAGAVPSIPQPASADNSSPFQQHNVAANELYSHASDATGVNRLMTSNQSSGVDHHVPYIPTVSDSDSTVEQTSATNRRERHPIIADEGQRKREFIKCM